MAPERRSHRTDSRASLGRSRLYSQERVPVTMLAVLFAFVSPSDGTDARHAVSGLVRRADGTVTVGGVATARPTFCREQQGAPHPRQASCQQITANIEPWGYFSIALPASMWTIRVEVDGFAPMRYDLHPLVRDTDLPTVTLEPSSACRVVAPSSSPLEVQLRPTSEPKAPRPLNWKLWIPERLTVTDQGISLTLPHSRPEIRVFEPSLGEGRLSCGKPVFSEASRKSIDHLQVTTVDLRPVEGNLSSRDWFICRALPGRACPISWEGLRWQDLHLETASGLRGVATGIDDQQIRFRLATQFEIRGVMRSQEGVPINGAVVWLPDAPDHFAVTGTEGQFQLTSDRAHATISGDASGYHLQAQVWNSTEVDRSIALSLKGAVDIKGRLIDTAGAPIEGVDIEYRIQSTRTRSQTHPLIFPSRRVTRARTSGQFRLEDLPLNETIVVEAAVQGYLPARQEAPADPTKEIILVLEQGHTVEGWVVDAEGMRVPGTRLLLLRPAKNSARFFSARELSQTSRALGPLLGTDSEGHFSMSGVPAGEFDLLLEKEGYSQKLLPIEMPSNDAVLSLGVVTLEHAATFEVTVHDSDGVPISDAEVLMVNSPADPWFLHSRDSIVVEPGQRRFEGLRGDEVVDLRVLAPGFVTRDYSRLAVSTKTLTVGLDRGVPVEGIVIDDDSEGVAGATLYYRKGTGEGPFPGSVQTDDDGRFAIDGLHEGWWHLRAESMAGASSDLGVELSSDGVTDLVIRVHKPKGILRGVVRTDDGLPLSDATVYVEAGPSTMTVADGSYILGNIPTQRLALLVRHRYLSLIHREVLDVVAGEQTLDITVVGSNISGIVITKDGRGVSDALVVLKPHAGDVQATSEVNADGSFAFLGVSAGRYSINAIGAGGRSVPQELVVQDADVGGLELLLGRDSTLEGNIVGIDPEEALKSTLLALSSTEGVVRGTILGGNRYRVPGLSVGSWRVTMRTASGRQAMSEVTIAENGEKRHIDLVFDHGFVVKGRILKDGRPFANASVLLLTNDRTHQDAVQSDYLGQFEFRDLPSGLYVVAGMGAERDVFVDGDVRIDLVAQLTGLRGQILDIATGSPLGGARIYLEALTRAGGSGAAVTTAADGNGEFVFQDLQVGDYLLTVSHYLYSVERRRVSLGTSETAVRAIYLTHRDTPKGEGKW